MEKQREMKKKLSEEELKETTAIILLSGEEEVTLLPLVVNRPPHLFFVAGKRIIDWLIETMKNVGIQQLLLISNQEKVTMFQEQLQHYYQQRRRTHEKSNNQSFEFFSFNSTRGFTAADIKLLQTKITKNSLWVDGNCLFSEPFLRAFLAKGFESENLALVKENGEKGKEESLGLGFFQHDVLDAVFLGATKVAEISLQSNQKQSGRTLTLLPLKKEEMEFWRITYPWQLLDANQKMIAYIEEKRDGLIEEGATIIGQVSIGRGARIRAGSYLEGPLVIGEECDIGPNCYLRKGVALGRKVRIGNACELKNVIVEEGTHIAHLSYVGDSIIGAHCNFGAGTITGNLRLDDQPVKAAIDHKVHHTGRRKLGAIIGDNVKTAINVYFMPGVIVGNSAAIGTGVIVQRNIADSVFIYIEQQLQKRKWSPSPRPKKE